MVYNKIVKRERVLFLWYPLNINIVLVKEGDIMATRSFTDSYRVNKKDLHKLHDIINNQRRIEVKEIKGHKEVKGHAIAKMLNLGK